MSLPDLDVRSVLDDVEENFQRQGLVTYAIRMIYAGEHTLSKEDLIKCFEQTINDVNSNYCNINVNGLLLVYDSYFVHIIEGSEDTVHRQLRFLLKNEENWIQDMKGEEEGADKVQNGLLKHEPEKKSDRKIFKRLKMLMVYHSIATMLFNDWKAITAKPPSLVGKLDVLGQLSEHFEHLKICIAKLNKLCALAKSDIELSFEGLSAVDPKIEALPEVALLDFLLKSQHILDLHYVIKLHRRVDDYNFYFETVWPLPTHYTPRLLYTLKIDSNFVEPLPVMPWEMVKKDKDEDDDKDDQQSARSSSD
ncbi:hypothetical protein ACJJTC_014599 [Scirpophaga incertulas]